MARNFARKVIDVGLRGSNLRNHKDAPVNVEVREPVGGDWEIVNSSFTPEKLDARAVGFEVPVAKDGTAKLTYRVRVKW